VVSVASLGAGFRRLLHAGIVSVAMLALAAPLLLGPAYGAVVRLVAGAEAVHSCACGMQRGRCGCSECEEIEAQRVHDAEGGVVVLRSSCDGDAVAITSAVPPATLPSLHIVPRAAEARVAIASSVLADPSSVPIRPPTPPPRRGSARALG
jgi:hypothetical protein